MNHRKRHRLVNWMALIVFVTGALFATSCAPRESPSLRLGIAYGNRLIWMPDEDLAASLDDAVLVGANWVRADLSWESIQPQGPDNYRWHVFDRVVTAAAARGLTVLPVLAYTPPWARPAGCNSDKCAPADPEAFATFAEAAAVRYAPHGIHTWEIWNEPNIPDFWKPVPNSAAYTTLLRMTSQALRHADPSTYVILGGIVEADTGNGGILPTDFLAAVLARGGDRFVDAVGYHPYTYPYLASAKTSWGTAWETIGDTPDSLRGVLSAHGTPDMPLWITEFGAPTNGPGIASDGRAATIEPTATHVTEERQASIAADVVRTAARTPQVSALIWYAERDLRTDTLSKDNFFGLRRADGSEKPALGALRRAIDALGD